MIYYLKKLIRFLFYETARLLVKWSFGIFFSRTYVYNKQYLEYENPCIPISNHPNTLIDVLGFAEKIKHRIFFLANAGLFESSLGNWFFSTFYCIPIKRMSDKGDRKINNEHSFDKAHDHLSKGGSIYIAPQGGSEIMRRIGKIKTGTARIALSAEAKNDFNLGLTILPAGISYSAQHDFQSEMIINVGAPIDIVPYRELYEKNKKQAVIKLTKDMKDAMSDLIISTENEKEDALLHKVDTLLQNNETVRFDKAFVRSKKSLNTLRAWRENQPDSYEEFLQGIETYFSLLDQNYLKDDAVLKASKNGRASGFWKMSKMLLGFPFWLYGYINNFLAASVPVWVFKKLKLYIGYTATVMVTVGLLSFPIFYFLQTWLVHSLFSNWILTLVYLISLPLLGYFAWLYEKGYKEMVEFRKAISVKEKTNEAFEQMSALRSSLLSRFLSQKNRGHLNKA